jgi:glycosyltransferase involved in cell wall biosynthesis
VISALRDAGVDVFERHEGVWEGRRDNWTARWGAAIRLLFAEVRLRFAPKVPFDAVIVGYPGHFDVPRARRVAGRRPLIFNPLVSLHETLVTDRGRFRRGRLGASVLSAVDRRALRKPDLVVADTEANADFLAELGGIPRARVRVCLVGAEDRLFHAGWRPDQPFRVLFVGKLIPLHGLETILEAARLAPEVPVRIIGSGQLDRAMDGHPDNVEWVRWITYEDLPREYWGAGCALGIFGTSDKALRVIPNKAYQAIACGTPLITADTRGSRELLTDGENALLVPPGDPAALADAMRRIAAEPDLAKRLGAAGRRTYEERASEDVLGPCWRSLIEELL